jgi:hypothetical protein
VLIVQVEHMTLGALNIKHLIAAMKDKQIVIIFINFWRSPAILVIFIIAVCK